MERSATIDLTSYGDSGFAKLPAFADESIGAAMHADVVTLVRTAAETGSAPDDVLIAPESQAGFAGERPEDLISKVFTLHQRPVFAEFLRSGDVPDILEQLIGPDVDCFLSQYIFKNPGAWGQPWHQDSYYFPFAPARPIVGLWLAVTEATLDNGCLHVLAGSNHEPIHEHVPDARPGANYGYVEIVDHDMGASAPVLMSPGDLLVFDSHLMHRSTDNASDGIRAAMVFHCCAAGTEDLGHPAIGGAPSPVHRFVPLLRDGDVVGT
ncbi:MAG: phytanoyl-CoA dioxygenase family protein [Actinomycetota bacterium]